jgi:hypothetical protein
MGAVVAVAILLALWPVWLSLGIASLLLGLPVAITILGPMRVPRSRLPWRAGIMAAAPGLVLLAWGWFCSRWMISSFQQREGVIRIARVEGGDWYAFWGLSVPMAVTGLWLGLFVARMVTNCASRRRADLTYAAVAYTMALAIAWLASFEWLRQEIGP